MAHFGEPPDLEALVLRSVSRLERVLFGTSLRRNIRNEKSRFYSMLPRYGAAASARMLVANLWILFFFPFFVCAVILDVVTNGNSPLRALSYAFLGVFLAGCFITIVRTLMAARSGTRSKRS